MKLRYKEVRVRMRDGAAIVTKRVPAWEFPVLQAVWPDTQEIRDIVDERESVSVQGEYDRLAALYGAETTEGGERGLPTVASVYGQHAAGIQQLRAAIQSSVLDESEEVTPLAPPPTIRHDLYEAIKPDIIRGVEEARLQARTNIERELVGVTE